MYLSVSGSGSPENIYCILVSPARAKKVLDVNEDISSINETGQV